VARSSLTSFCIRGEDPVPSLSSLLGLGPANQMLGETREKSTGKRMIGEMKKD